MKQCKEYTFTDLSGMEEDSACHPPSRARSSHGTVLTGKMGKWFPRYGGNVTPVVVIPVWLLLHLWLGESRNMLGKRSP
ncbi:hypothetical protein E2C01_021681 [Portunus trituberculatus]|uniref:Uncharacterized protein n=1 Tax=Portunus trituberculatus TaxID=210409 RepID=A0A5B7E577_PORTR|nr:hypothetical protein [Portunus trituberculatus]